MVTVAKILLGKNFYIPKGNKQMRKILGKIWFEIRMHCLDWRWQMKGFHCWEPYPPSFYYRYTPEEQARIWEKDKKELQEMIKELKN